MNDQIRKLEPNAVWNNFVDLNAVPRPSKKEERVIQFMLDFGISLGLETFKDKVGNVIIRKSATSGMENRKMVTLQSHLDMVHQKNAATNFDFNTQGIQMQIDGDWVKANGTTLGADNGLGVATIMSLLQSKNIPHPVLEALFTIDEETGMTGAMGLEGGILKGDILLNLDTEEDDELDIGCAGGMDITAIKIYKEESIEEGYLGYQLTVKGLQGGHSGIEIHKGLGNANKIMNRLLYMGMENHEVLIASINGGGLRNAIPRESTSIITLKTKEEQSFKKGIEELANTIKAELAIMEPNLIIELAAVGTPERVMESYTQNELLKVLYAAHNGVYAMSASMDDLVETSNNIARVEVNKGTIKIGCLTRSSVNSAKLDLGNTLKSTFELGGFNVIFGGDYPGWKPNPDSNILKVLAKQYEVLFNEKPKIAACHAGLECGILGQNYPNMDMISFGPTILGAHSPDERVSISSVQKFWKFTLEILKNIPKK